MIVIFTNSDKLGPQERSWFTNNLYLLSPHNHIYAARRDRNVYLFWYENAQYHIPAKSVVLSIFDFCFFLLKDLQELLSPHLDISYLRVLAPETSWNSGTPWTGSSGSWSPGGIHLKKIFCCNPHSRGDCFKGCPVSKCFSVKKAPKIGFSWSWSPGVISCHYIALR